MFFKDEPAKNSVIPNITKGKLFFIGDLLSVVFGKAYSRDPYHDLVKFLNFMTNDNIFPHKIATVADICKPYVLAQHPQSKEIPSKNPYSTYHEWIEIQIKKYGEYLTVKPIPEKEYQLRDPINDIIEMRKPIV